MRKVLIVLLVVLSIGATAISIYFVLSKGEEPMSDTLYDAIPLDAGLIVDIRDYAELCGIIRDHDLLKQLSGIPSIGKLAAEMMSLDSMVQQQTFALPLRQHIIFSTHPVGKEEMGIIAYVKIESEKSARNLVDEIKQQLSGKIVFTDRIYDHVTISDISFINEAFKKYNFSCAYRKGVFVCAHSPILLENALRQIAVDHNITHQNEQLLELIQTAGKLAPANIYINYNQLPRMALTVLHNKHRQAIEPLSHYASWTELDLNIKPDLMLFNGFTTTRPMPQHWLDAFRTQPALPMTLTDAMPSTTYAFFWMGIRHITQYFNALNQYQEQHKETDYIKQLNQVKSTYQIDLQKDFAGLFEDEAALIYANIGQTDFKESAFPVFRIKSTSLAVTKLEEWQELTTKRNNSDTKQERAILEFDNQLAFTAYRFPFDIPASIFGDTFIGDNTWCVVANNYLVFGSSPANLKKYLHYTALHSTLQTDLSYGKLINHFSTRSNLMFYLNPSLSDSFLENVLRNDKFKEMGTIPAPSRMQAVVYQLNASGDMLYNNLFFKYSSEESIATGTQTSWESLLDTAISFKPQLLQNHNTGETEIFVQDMANNAYLLNNVGRILWKIKLPEPILSPVYQVDYYRNGKLQMLFNTKNSLYIVDRLGNMVDKYPVKLNAPAAGSVALFDYDNNRDYRMLIACEDRKVYAYNKNGKPVEGWSFRQSDHPVQSEIYHYRVENKDYIVFADKYKVYILDRQGRTRITPDQHFPVAKNTTITLDRIPKQSSLVLTDTTGCVHFISLANGEVSKREIKNFSADHFFVFQDVEGDRKGNFIFANGNKLEIFRQDGKQICEIETEEPIMSRPYVYEFSTSDIKIGIVQPKSNLIWLYQNNGKASKGFPMKGSSPFSIGRLDKSSTNFNLFVGSQNNFIYNYSVK